MLRSVTAIGMAGGLLATVVLFVRAAEQPEELRVKKANPAEIGPVVQSSNAFAVDLYLRLAKENGGQNLFFSPYSISGALAMTGEGARGETAAQMARVLRYPDAFRNTGADAEHLPWTLAPVHTGFAALNDALTGERNPEELAQIEDRIATLRKELAIAQQKTKQLDDARKFREAQQAADAERSIVNRLNAALAQVNQYEIRVANALWGEQTYPFRQEYLDTIARHYKSGGLFPVDFRTNFAAARERINDWVSNETNERIPELLPVGVLDEFTRLVLTNAIYFRGDWAEPFDPEATREEDFRLADGTAVKTALMAARSHEAARYAAFEANGSLFKTPRMMLLDQTEGLYPGADGFAMVELPYRGDALSMVVIAPNDPAGLDALEARLSAEALSEWIGHLRRRETHVYLPKFKLETDYNLGSGGLEPTGTLPEMGMVRAFTDPRKLEQAAQFDGMTTSTSPQDRLYISAVLHKAFLEVNEEGTEAAAATAVVMAAPRSAIADARVPFTPTFRADRPFLFVIRDQATGCILFMGRMTAPPEA